MSHIPGSNPWEGKCGCSDTPGERFTANCCMFACLPYCGHAWGRTKLWDELHNSKMNLVATKERRRKKDKMVDTCRRFFCFGQEDPARASINFCNTFFHCESMWHLEKLYPFPNGFPVICVSCWCLPCALSQETRAVITEYVQQSTAIPEDDPDAPAVPESLDMLVPGDGAASGSSAAVAPKMSASMLNRMAKKRLLSSNAEEPAGAAAEGVAASAAGDAAAPAAEAASLLATAPAAEAAPLIVAASTTKVKDQ
jgi:hypothetical protein